MYVSKGHEDRKAHLVLGCSLCASMARRSCWRDLKGYRSYCEKVRYRLIPHVW